MPTLLLDIGNSRIKAAWWQAGHMGAVQSYSHAEGVQLGLAMGLNPAQAASHHAPRPARILACNVAGAQIRQALAEKLLPLTDRIEWFDSARALAVLARQEPPWISHYSAQLGTDRLAGALGAEREVAQTWPSATSVLVVSAGTALTIDHLRRVVVGESATRIDFMGGVIMAGLGTMRQALAQHTAQLPLPSVVLGDSHLALLHQLNTMGEMPTQTEDALAAGALVAALGAVQQLAHAVQAELVLLTGGAGALLHAALIQERHKAHWQYRDNLCLRGLADYAARTA